MGITMTKEEAYISAIVDAMHGREENGSNGDDTTSPHQISSDGSKVAVSIYLNWWMGEEPAKDKYEWSAVVYPIIPHPSEPELTVTDYDSILYIMSLGHDPNQPVLP